MCNAYSSGYTEIDRSYHLWYWMRSRSDLLCSKKRSEEEEKKNQLRNPSNVSNWSIRRYGDETIANVTEKKRKKNCVLIPEFIGTGTARTIWRRCGRGRMRKKVGRAPPAWRRTSHEHMDAKETTRDLWNLSLWVAPRPLWYIHTSQSCPFPV